MNKWISVDDRLPELVNYQPGWGKHSDLVLCWMCGLCGIGQYVERNHPGPHSGKRGWDFVSGEVRRRPDVRVTHWMPLPGPPNTDHAKG